MPELTKNAVSHRNLFTPHRCHFERSERQRTQSREGNARCPAEAPEGKRQTNLCIEISPCVPFGHLVEMTASNNAKPAGGAYFKNILSILFFDFVYGWYLTGRSKSVLLSTIDFLWVKQSKPSLP